MKNSIAIFIFFFCLMANSSYAQIYKWVDENGRTQYSDKPHLSAQVVPLKDQRKHISQTVTKNTPKPYGNTITQGGILDSNIIKLRKLLNQKKFIELNKVLQIIVGAYQSRVISEDDLLTVYFAFRIKSSSFAEIFDSWVVATPNSYQPYLARAIFQYQMGWLSRGAKWRSETNDKQINEMSAYFNKASGDFLKALDLKGVALISYYYLIGITNIVGSDVETEKIMKKALEIYPASFRIRSHYIKTLAPKWGGSFEQMQAYAKESSHYIDLNPRLKIIESLIFVEAGDMQALANRYNIADKFYSKGLELGEYHYILFKKGENNSRRNNYQHAIIDLNKAIELSPEKPMYYYWRAKSYIKLEKYYKAMKDIQLAYQLDPYDTEIQSKQKWLSKHFSYQAYKSREAQNSGTAIEEYNAAIRLNPNNARAYDGRARAYIQLGNLAQALVDTKKAIEINPDDYYKYKLIDYILQKSKDFPQIIQYWKKYIELHPNDGRAYVEVGGAYYHNGDIKLALINAKRSADLGNMEGVEVYNKYKHLIQESFN